MNITENNSTKLLQEILQSEAQLVALFQVPKNYQYYRVSRILPEAKNDNICLILQSLSSKEFIHLSTRTLDSAVQQSGFWALQSMNLKILDFV